MCFMYLTLTLSLLEPDFARKRLVIVNGGCHGCLPKPIALSSRNAEAGETLINLNSKAEVTVNQFKRESLN